MSRRKSLLAAGLLAATFLTACASTGTPTHPEIATPGGWTQLAPTVADAPLVAGPDADVDQGWWRHFDDPVLDGLIARALADNKTLAIAKARVEEARAGRAAARARLFPEITAGTGVQRGNQGVSGSDKVVALSSAEVRATWDLDLFGRNQARVAEAVALLESEEASQKAVRVALLAEVARTYFELRDAQRQVELASRNLTTQRRTLELVRAQARGAEASAFDIERAAAQVSATEALIPTFKVAATTARNRLNVLLGQPPGTIDEDLAEPVRFKPLDRRILIAAPAKVLATRPDVRAAERRLAASVAASEAATAELFPNISLTALFGLQSANIMSATPWGLAANLVLPVLDFGRIRAGIDQADARQTQAFLAYQQRVLEALENMENALSGHLNETARNASLAAAVGQTSRAAALAKNQYAEGYIGLLDVLTSERDLLAAEASRAASDARLRLTLVDIFTAAGGGWE